MDQTAGGWSGRRVPAVPWDEFDSLPLPLRRSFKFAPYNYTPILAIEAYARGESVENILRVRRARDIVNVRREALRLYGPTHPQAGRPR